jgi:hypothetical protein
MEPHEESQELETFIGIGNQLRYRCPEWPKCKFNSFREGFVLKHWFEEHAQRQQQIGTTLFDANEKPIKVEKVVIPKALHKIYEQEVGTQPHDHSDTPNTDEL